MVLRWCLVISDQKSFPTEKYSISNNYFIIIHITNEISTEPAILHIYTHGTHNENEFWKKTINLEMDE